MPRPIWSGALSFGLVNIPVEVHTAVRDSRPHFRMLHAKDHSPVNFERVCQKTASRWRGAGPGQGYEYEKGHFVVLTKEDFAAAALEKTRRIDILDFVKTDTIDDRFFDKPYYLVPGKGGDLAYACCAKPSASASGSASRSSSCARCSISPRSKSSARRWCSRRSASPTNCVDAAVAEAAGAARRVK